MITLAIQCHNFQRRLCWMLSSLAQQTVPELVTVDIACMRENGKPTTEEVAGRFSGGLKVELDFWDDFKAFQRRGFVRNKQLRECRTDWLMFGDSDMVYHPEYFERLCVELSLRHPVAKYMLSSGRTSNPKEKTNELVDFHVLDTAAEVAGAFKLADALPKHPMRNCGAGFCQIINVKHCPHEGYYVDGSNRDWDWNRGSNPRSDVQFRRRVSGLGGQRQALPDWFTAGAIHLNHNRDPDFGRHLEEQR
jgi:hypothetical protein